MEGILRRVRALLAKAEGTDNIHEQEAFFAKAQTLMAKYQISEAQLIVEGLRQNQPVNHKKITFPQQVGRRDKTYLLQHIAKLLHGRSFQTSPKNSTKKNPFTYPGSVTIVGTAEDIHLIELLWTTLCMQLDIATSKYVKQNSGQGVHGRTLRRSFVNGWCTRVRELLTDAYSEVEKVEMSSSTELVFIGREKAVGEYIGERWKLSNSSRKIKVDLLAQGDGYVEGNRADVRLDNKIGSTGRKELV